MAPSAPGPAASLPHSSPLTCFLLAPNPGPMSLDGTNSYVIGNPSGPLAIVDPGPLEESHLRQLAGAGRVELILITHRHADHTEGAPRLHELTGAPVRAIDPAHCHGGAPLQDGEVIWLDGTELRVLATPGHTSDSVCFHLPEDGSVLTGDTILGRGTTIIDYPDGRLGAYLESLEALKKLATPGPLRVLPGHGPVLPDLAQVSAAYLAHRHQRLDQIRSALEHLGADAPVPAVTDLVYSDVDPAVRRAAEASVTAQLDYLHSPTERQDHDEP